MQNIAEDCLHCQSKDSWTGFSLCTTMASFVLASRTAHKILQYDMDSFIYLIFFC